MKISELKTCFLVPFSLITGFIAKFLGGWDSLIQCLVIFMIIDFITGITLAVVFGKSTKSGSGGASSRAGFKGIVKKIVILLIITLSVCVETVLQTDYIRNVTILFFIGNEGLSILENTALMGVKYPEILKKALDVIKESEEERKIK